MIEKAELNIVDDSIDTNVEEVEVDEEFISTCEDCGVPLKPEWKACPSCGKVVSPFDVWEVLATIKGAPNRETIESLKAEKGLDIRMAVVDEDRIYLITPIMRDRWKVLNSTVSKIKDDTERQDRLSELVVEACVIWPKPNSPLFGNRAFTNATLFEQILHISDYIPPQVAVQMVYKL
jgi:hypothetical protein